MFRNLVLCLCCLFLAACAGREQSSAPPPADFVSTTLGHAAEQAHGELAMIARLRGQGLQPLLLPSDPSLNLPVSITWTGPVEGALKEICLQLGFRYREAGTPSAQVMTVVVHGLNRPAHGRYSLRPPCVSTPSTAFSRWQEPPARSFIHDDVRPSHPCASAPSFRSP